jgi:hypothetical protein
MALSMNALNRRGSMVPLPGGGWKLEISTKFKWNTEQVRKKLGEGRRRALERVGFLVKTRTQKGMSSRRPRKTGRQVKIANRFGFDLIALIDRVPKTDSVTSWKTSRHPKGFLRSDIEDDYDTRSQSVVVGPSLRPKINQLHEFGGTTTRYFVPIPRRGKRNAVFGVLANVKPKAGRGRDAPEQTGIFSFQTNIKGRKFQAKGLRLAAPKIPQQFRNQLRGP